MISKRMEENPSLNCHQIPTGLFLTANYQPYMDEYVGTLDLMSGKQSWNRKR